MRVAMPPFGVLNIDKPPGRTSRDVVDRVERLTAPARAGHAGTLDPLATGVLVVCVGQATRLIEYIQRMPKRYRATFLLGRRSDTDDVEGEVTLVPGAPEPTRAMLDEALPKFLGEIQQRPPAHSAVKLAGRRAYQLARRGEPVELAPRPVAIHGLDICRYAYPELELTIECGSGTYVRALGRDLAAAVGTAAVMSALVRTAVGRFRIEDAVRLADLTAGNLSLHLRPALAAVASLPQVRLSEAEAIEIRNGRPIRLPEGGAAEAAKPQAAIRAGQEGEWAAVDAAGQLLSILREKHPGELWPAKNFL
jgi:tRNA pseudouridine55 synthase